MFNPSSYTQTSTPLEQQPFTMDWLQYTYNISMTSSSIRPEWQQTTVNQHYPSSLATSTPSITWFEASIPLSSHPPLEYEFSLSYHPVQNPNNDSVVSPISHHDDGDSKAVSNWKQQSINTITTWKQDSRYDTHESSQDQYTPRWVRYKGHRKEGFCESCQPGKWLQLKNSAYWYHKQFFHGISSVTGARFRDPIECRVRNDMMEGLCHQCHQFISMGRQGRKYTRHQQQQSVLWYRHAHKCHINDKSRPTAAGKRALAKKAVML